MIWITGASGMLGQDVSAFLAARGNRLIKSDMEIDIADKFAVFEFAKAKPIEWIVNCAAYTAVDAAESDKESAFAANGLGVENLARIACEKNAKLIHVSTDYVFDGKKGKPYIETDPPNPISIYGKSKLDGEQRLIRQCRRHFIIRTSGLYGLNGRNFVNTMLGLYAAQDRVRVVNDQKTGTTYTKDLAELIGTILEQKSREYGIYHFSNQGCISWHDFAAEIYRRARLLGIISGNVSIEPISSRDFPLPAKRPEQSCMSVEKAEKTFGIKIPDWRNALKRYLEEFSNTCKTAKSRV